MDITKRRWRAHKARVATLPAPYRESVDAVQRYLFFFGPGTAESCYAMLDDLVELFEQAAAAGTPVREVVGTDPVDFAETFLRNYPEGGWITRERERLNAAIDRAAGGPAPDPELTR